MLIFWPKPGFILPIRVYEMSKSSYAQACHAVEFEYGYIQEGETASGLLCTTCNGGASKEGSFSVSRRGGILLWTCHRASCNFKGSSDYVGVPRQQRQERKGKGKYFLQTHPLSEEAVKVLAAKYRVTEALISGAGLGWTGDCPSYFGRRVSFPILAPDSRRRGESYRSFEGADPKSVIHMVGDDLLTVAWYTGKRSSKDVVLVEDQASALKLSPHIHAAALLGTHISESKAEEIKAQGYRYVYLSLDADATGEAVRQAIKFKQQLPNLRIVGLGTDIKDHTPEQFEKYLREVGVEQ